MFFLIPLKYHIYMAYHTCFTELKGHRQSWKKGLLKKQQCLFQLILYVLEKNQQCRDAY